MGFGIRITVAALALATVVRAEPRTQNPEPRTFHFQNNFWVNLHHVLRGEARRREVRARPAIRIDALTPSERAAWASALDAYAPYGGRDLVFDPALIRINNVLTTIADGDSSRLRPAGLDAAAARALALAEPVYRAHYWAAQRELNDRWIAAAEPMIAAHGASMAAAIERAYGVTWPRDPIVVDACAEAGPNGGYTTDGPPGTAGHTVIEAANPEYQGDMAFEMIFHEASHTSPIGGRLFDVIRAEAARQHVTPPGDLYHVIVFYTAGELARRVLGRVGDAHYMPYAYRYDVYTRGWQPLRDAVVREWQPHLDGERTFDEAVAALVRETAR